MLQVGRGGETQRRGEQDRPDDGRVAAVLEGEVRAERPAEQPDVRQLVELGVLDGGGDVEALADRVVEGPLAGAAHAAGPPGVEAEHRQVGQGRQTPRRLAEHVAVHHPAVRRQRVQADEGAHWLPVQRPGQLADQPQTVSGVQLDVLAVPGQDGGRADRCAHPTSLAGAAGNRRAGRKQRDPDRSAVAGSTATALDDRPTPVAGTPAPAVPVPPVGQVAPPVRRPRHQVRHPGPDLLVTAGTAVRLGGHAAADPAYLPVAVAPLLHRGDALPGPVGVEVRGVIAAGSVATGAHACQAYGPAAGPARGGRAGPAAGQSQVSGSPGSVATCAPPSRTAASASVKSPCDQLKSTIRWALGMPSSSNWSPRG